MLASHNPLHFWRMLLWRNDFFSLMCSSIQCCCDDWLGWTVSTYCWFANSRADAVQRNYGGACVQMRLSFSSLAPFFLYFIQWLDCGCCYALPSYLGLFHILICKVKLQYVVLEFGPLIFVSLYRRPGCRELKSSCFVYTGLCWWR